MEVKGEVVDWRMQEVVGGEQNRRPFLGQENTTDRGIIFKKREDRMS